MKPPPQQAGVPASLSRNSSSPANFGKRGRHSVSLIGKKVTFAIHLQIKIESVFSKLGMCSLYSHPLSNLLGQSKPSSSFLAR